MEILFYFFIFIMGTVFGSFFTLAVYRIPLGLNITHERSFCPKCKHKLGFWDLIPIISYISLGGKCRYCGEKIRIRYLFLEVLSGLVFLISFLSFDMNFPFFALPKVLDFVAFTFLFITLIIILGIDKENVNIDKKVLLFGIITQTIYIIYLYISKRVDVNRYTIYLVIMLLLSVLDYYFLKKQQKNIYLIHVLMLIDYILLYVNSKLIIFIVGFGILIAAIYYIYSRIKDSTKDAKIKVPIGFCLSISSIILIILNQFLTM